MKVHDCFRIPIIVALACAAGGSLVLAEEPSNTQGLVQEGTPKAEDLFPLGVYWAHSYAVSFAKNENTEIWTYADRILGDLAHHHCNLVWATNIEDTGAKRLCELAKGHGIHVALLPEAVMHPFKTRQAATPRAVARAAETTFRTFGDTKGVWGYVLDDEPPIGALPYLDALENELLRLDPTRPVTTVFRRTEAVPAIGRYNFRIVTYDCYPFGHARDTNLPNTPAASRQFYRGVTEVLGRLCERRGVTFWVMPGAFQEIWGNWYWSQDMTVVAEPGAYLHWRMPTVGETRWQIWEAVAAGAKGIVYYLLWPERNFRRTSPDSPRDPDQEARADSDEAGPKLEKTWDTGEPGALLHVNSTPTRQLVAMGQAYRQVATLAPILQKLRFSNIPAAFSRAPLQTRTFRDGEGELYALVVNDNTDSPTTMPLTVLPGIQAVRDLRRGQELELVAEPNSGLLTATVSLEAGGGTLLQLVSPAATRPLVKLLENFSSPALLAGLKLERVELQEKMDRWEVARYHVLVLAKDAGKMPGTVTAPVYHNSWSLKPSGPMYMVYQGGGEVEPSFSADGKRFAAAQEKGFDIPIPMPGDTRFVRFTMTSGQSRLNTFCVIATER